MLHNQSPCILPSLMARGLNLTTPRVNMNKHRRKHPSRRQQEGSQVVGEWRKGLSAPVKIFYGEQWRRKVEEEL